jgi:vacuolar-type H+-ATPase subunit I/STV1
MIEENKNLKDASLSPSTTIKDTSITTSTAKTNKLITALFMVTDILDKEEPLRIKLRQLGTDVVSDMYFDMDKARGKIDQILSFLDIASAMRMVSEMNTNILKKEFMALRESIKTSVTENYPAWLEEFVRSTPESSGTYSENENQIKVEKIEIENKKNTEPKTFKVHKGHQTGIGIQKGSTLMKALSKVSVSDKLHRIDVHTPKANTRDSFDVLKKERRDDIIKIIERNKESHGISGSTITDIRNGAKELTNSNVKNTIHSCSEKTLQRELISMLKDGVLKKTGEKRWSKYFVAK